ncbi:hypothetical protein CEXT_561431 [Caerostris extrusa]|uniref:Uncharacterized protein n=1 Tax=Caerostris extrusa TaxID=172846 RepID=A0AAV4TL55_CAEEX|nr:hypothetical protein CEXT_561431 [Caerostris extrusa]
MPSLSFEWACQSDREDIRVRIKTSVPDLSCDVFSCHGVKTLLIESGKVSQQCASVRTILRPDSARLRFCLQCALSNMGIRSLLV